MAVERVRFERKATRDLSRLSPDIAQTIVNAIDSFARQGIGDVRKLRDVQPATWRLRVGRFRVLYRRYRSIIIVMAIVDRRDAYR